MFWKLKFPSLFHSKFPPLSTCKRPLGTTAEDSKSPVRSVFMAGKLLSYAVIMEKYIEKLKTK
jgi:hypothetical protein